MLFSAPVFHLVIRYVMTSQTIADDSRARRRIADKSSPAPREKLV